MNRLNAKVLRKIIPSQEDLKNIKRNPIYLVLDEVIDTYNIGSLFRLADATGVSKMYLCGNMDYPPSSRVHKAAVGTENWVPWEKCNSTIETVKGLKSKSVKIISVEQSSLSTSYQFLSGKLSFPCAVVLRGLFAYY